MSTTDRRDGVDAADAGENLFDTLKKMKRLTELGLRVAAPGSVIAYNPLTQTAQVQIGYLPIRSEDTPAGEVETPEAPIIIPAAQVAWVQGATHYDYAPLAPGDSGLCVFCDRALDLWYSTPPGGRVGGAAGSVDPVDGRAHDPADAVFFPGLSPAATRSPPPVNPAARTIEAPIIALGAAAAAAGPALRGTPVSAAFTAYTTALTTAGGVWTTATGGVPAVATPLINGTYILAAIAANTALVATLATWLSNKVFVE